MHAIIIKTLTLMFDIYFKRRNICERNFSGVTKSQKLQKYTFVLLFEPFLWDYAFVILPKIHDIKVKKAKVSSFKVFFVM